MRDWQREAPIWIANAVKDLPEKASLKERRDALRKVALQFHMGTSWGKKVWSKHCRKYLGQHGLEPIKKKVEDHPHFGDDIIFPFRKTD